ncbi:hypothetical protein DXG01_016837 [Tephrocybe rancida]|nr:hypothetical protein DXG01_016837 [Tephrocybe rancida]
MLVPTLASTKHLSDGEEASESLHMPPLACCPVIASAVHWKHIKPKDATKRQHCLEKCMECQKWSDSIKDVATQQHSSTSSLQTDANTEQLPIALSGWMGLCQPTPVGGLNITKLLARGFSLFSWDGLTTRQILDTVSCQIGFLTGHPKGLSWDDNILAAKEMM